jgi:catalase
LNNEEAHALTADNPDHAQEDLFNAIERGEYPSWTVYVQTMTAEQAEKAPFSVFDLTKVWPHADYPRRRFGKLVLNKNPENYFAEVEQAAFSPAHTVPGIEPSADPVLQARLFAYNDTQRYRLGVNFQQLPINCPLHAFNPFQRDGRGVVNGNFGGKPNYPSSLEPNSYRQDIQLAEGQETWVGPATDFHWAVTDADYIQPKLLWQVFAKTGQQENFVHNLSLHLKDAIPELQDRTFQMFSKVSPDLGSRIQKATLKLSPRNH